MDLRLLSSHVDWLECSFFGVADRGILDQLEDFKNLLAQDEECEPFEYEIDGISFYLQRRASRMYRYYLKGDFGSLFITPSTHLPSVRIIIEPIAIAEHGLGEAIHRAQMITAKFCDTERSTVSRLDLATDFHGWVPNFDELHCNFHSRYKKEKPIFDGSYLETFYLGGGNLMLRIYDKSREISKFPEKSYVRAKWEQSSAFHPDETVFRVEYQARRGLLKNCEVGAIEEVPESLAGLWQLCQSEMRLTIPTGDSRRDRRPTHPAWESLSAASFPGGSVERVRELARLESDYKAIARREGGLQSIAARRALTSRSQAVSLAEQLTDEYYRRKGKTFDELVEEKMRRLRSGE